MVFRIINLCVLLDLKNTDLFCVESRAEELFIDYVQHPQKLPKRVLLEHTDLNQPRIVGVQVFVQSDRLGKLAPAVGPRALLVGIVRVGSEAISVILTLLKVGVRNVRNVVRQSKIMYFVPYRSEHYLVLRHGIFLFSKVRQGRQYGTEMVSNFSPLNVALCDLFRRSTVSVSPDDLKEHQLFLAVAADRQKGQAYRRGSQKAHG